MPAEWEHQRAVQLTWPHENTDWKPYLDEAEQTFTELAKAIADREDLIVVTPDRQRVEKRLGKAGNIVIVEAQTDDTWARDHGFITLVEEGGPCTRHMLDFRFNGWGEKFPADNDNLINKRLFASGAVEGCYHDHNDFVLEGGSIETDGKGTVFTTSMCLEAPHRNQPLDHDQLDAALRQRLHAKRTVWLDHGQLIGDDTDGHIDTIVRCAPDDTLLYITCANADDPQHAGLAALERQLKALKTAEGNAYRLIALPTPAPMTFEGDRLPATYANFLVVNGAVIVPTYQQPDNDSLAMRLIGTAFPDREIIGIDASVIVRQHGSLHCLTMQYY